MSSFTSSSTPTPAAKARLHKHGAGAVRHAEKRRVGTCAFADRMAQVSLACFRTRIPQEFREAQPQTCVSSILAYVEDTDQLEVLALGVGTKFLKHKLVVENGGTLDRVRDCHAEVLARRAFRLYLTSEIKKIMAEGGVLSSAGKSTILQNSQNPPMQAGSEEHAITAAAALVKPPKFELKPSVTLHMYTSSAPCGNATIKKFAQMKKETFDDGVPLNQWPNKDHEPIPAHSLPLGQFSLLVKVDRSIITTDTGCDQALVHSSKAYTKRQKPWPAMESDDWCPAGTSIPNYGKGTMHTCSDKLCRWNCLGLQGSLLHSFLQKPLYMSTLTVARKFTECICRRAVCCRANGAFVSRRKRNHSLLDGASELDHELLSNGFALSHPTIMGTGIYMDDSGVLAMEGVKGVGEDVRFHSDLAWVWCPAMRDAECINGVTGFAHDAHHVHSHDCALDNTANQKKIFEGNTLSQVSTTSFVRQYYDLHRLGPPCAVISPALESTVDKTKLRTKPFTEYTLLNLRDLKRQCSPVYEKAKDELLSNHRVLRGWVRRENFCRRPTPMADNG
jgi:hypothetical protein